MENKGYLYLFKKLKDAPFKTNPLVVALFIDLLLYANFMEQKIIWNKKPLIIGRGQLIVGRKALSKRTGISEQSIRTCLTILKSTNTITIKSTNRFSLISILNYDKYQPSQPTLQPSIQPTVNQQSTNSQPQIININNINKRETSENSFTKKVSYLEEIQNGGHPEDLRNFIGLYDCTTTQIKQKAQGLLLWLKQNNKTVVDYKALLESALLKDFGSKKHSGWINADTDPEFKRLQKAHVY